MGVPTKATIKRLFALCGNQCAYPGCSQPVVQGEALVGDVCHIAADNVGGPRYDPSQTPEERQHFDNLIVLCPNHHRIVDGDTVTYSVDRLKSMKRRHEGYAPTRAPFHVSDELAGKIRETLIAGASIAAAATAAVAVGQMLGPVVEGLLSMFFRPGSSTPSRRRLHDKLLNTLRYGPRGEVAFVATDELHRQLAIDLAQIFLEAGWRVANEASIGVRSEWPTPALTLLVRVRDENQMVNALRGVDQLLERLGFVTVEGQPAVARYDEKLRVVILSIPGSHMPTRF